MSKNRGRARINTSRKKDVSTIAATLGGRTKGPIALIDVMERGRQVRDDRGILGLAFLSVDTVSGIAKIGATLRVGITTRSACNRFLSRRPQSRRVSRIYHMFLELVPPSSNSAGSKVREI